MMISQSQTLDDLFESFPIPPSKDHLNSGILPQGVDPPDRPDSHPHAEIDPNPLSAQ
jgi:hypothetical protein